MGFEEFEGLCNFRYRVVVSTLLQKPIIVNAQLQEHHINFLRLIGKICDGSTTEITHSKCVFRPGLITGGDVTYKCVKDISWCLLPILPLFLFVKKPLNLKLSGRTDDRNTLEVIKDHAIPFLKNFGANVDDVEFKIDARGYVSDSIGSISIVWPSSATVKSLSSYSMGSVGKIIKIRGTTMGTKVPPATLNTIIGTSRKTFSEFIPDVYIYSIFAKGSHPGYLLSLIATTTEGLTYASSLTGEPKVNPVDMAKECCNNLFRTMKTSYLDPSLQCLALVLCACCEYTCELKIKRNSKNVWRFIDDIKRFTQKKVLISKENNNDPYLVQLSGIPLLNINRDIK